ncbi:MAG: GNAT family N-acetyltransferase [Ktedonobacteraceae bacterium]|jgi:GNAT superfamily N-acetyltransferase
MSLSFAALTTADLVEAATVVKAAYNTPHSRKASLQLYLTLQASQTGSSLVVRHNRSIVGFGGVVDYGPFAYVGLMSVHPSMQKQGIGARLLEHLLAEVDARGCPTTLLDATPAGAGLYKRYAFMEDDTTLVLQRTQHMPLPRHLPPGVSLLAEEDFPALVAFDTPYFGAERRVILAAYRAYNPERVLVAYNMHGQITGYLIAQSSVLGPWAARTPEDAEHLLVHALTLYYKEGEPEVFVSAYNSAALPLLTRYGFNQQRTLSHMRRGKAVDRARQTALYGQTSLGLG